MCSVRELSVADLPWVLEVTAQRRAALVPHAPRFWRSADDAAEKHRVHLGRLINDPAARSLRTDHGYAIGMASPPRLIIDDMVVDENHYQNEGIALLQAIAANSDVRFVCPTFETQRAELARNVGLTVVESWWHRDLEEAESTAAHHIPEDLNVDGTHGRLVSAPPIYDPGGPVLFVTKLRSASALREIELRAAKDGATVSVIAVKADDNSVERLARDNGYRRTTDFFEGRLSTD